MSTRKGGCSAVNEKISIKYERFLRREISKNPSDIRLRNRPTLRMMQWEWEVFKALRKGEHLNNMIELRKFDWRNSLIFKFCEKLFKDNSRLNIYRIDVNIQ